MTFINNILTILKSMVDRTESLTVPGWARTWTARTPVLSAGMWSCPALGKLVCYQLTRLTDANPEHLQIQSWEMPTLEHEEIGTGVSTRNFS